MITKEFIDVANILLALAFVFVWFRIRARERQRLAEQIRRYYQIMQEAEEQEREWVRLRNDTITLIGQIQRKCGDAVKVSPELLKLVGLDPENESADKEAD